MTNERDVAEEVAEKDEEQHPDQRADHVEQLKARDAHRRGARDERRERAHDRDEAREHERLAAVPLVEIVGLLQRGAVEEAFEPRNVRIEDLRPDRAADQIVDRIAAHRRDEQQHEEARKRHFARRRERARDEEQRIARQEREDHEPRFAENDQEQHQIDPGAVLPDEIAEKCIDVHDEADEMKQRFQMRFLGIGDEMSARRPQRAGSQKSNAVMIPKVP